ncbi:MAG TPA: hypothetical protein VFB23_14520 [Candidatus Acidoferrales bacterium]|nr:hypothetical protein [Candidatus Acidoferrales bacterium]
MGNSTFGQISTDNRYSAYGLSISSELSLPLRKLSPGQTGGRCNLQIRISDDPLVTTMRERCASQLSVFRGFDFVETLDGWTYLHWTGVGETLISQNGESITCRPFEQPESESFRVYLLGQALSCALVKMGFEPLHATAVAVDDGAVAFVGDCGFGKSTLAASFLKAGHRLLTDDLLLLRTTRQGAIGYPGPPRIKLFPKIADTLLGQASGSVPLNPYTRKQIIPLDETQTCVTPVPVTVVYSLAPANEANGKGIRIAPLSNRESFVTLLGAAFNRVIVDGERLQRQFHAAKAMVAAVTVKKAFYPRLLSSLSQIREAIIADVCAIRAQARACNA